MHFHSLVVLVDPLGLFDPYAVSELAGSAQLELMLLLHFSRSHELASVPVVRWEITKDLENSVAHTVTCVINVLPTNVLRP